jgi:two-component system phosphate regulon sensor histidine kinase PhoR
VSFFDAFRRSPPDASPTKIISTAAAPPVPLEGLLAGLAEGVIVADGNNKILLANDALGPLLGQPAAEAAGKPLWEVLRHRELGDMMSRLQKGGAEETQELTFMNPLESVWRVTARPLALAGGKYGVILTFRNITQVKLLERYRKDFIANVSHELKTPLTALKAAVETLLDGAWQDKDHAKDFLETAFQHAERLQKLIEDILFLSRMERLDDPETQAPAQMIGAHLKKTVADLKPLADKKQVAVALEAPSPDFAVPLTQEEITQLLTNLADNAVKYTKPGGRVAIHSLQKEGRWMLTVADQGPGIAPEDAPRIFERFYRGDKAHSQDVPGTGLGLAIVKHIVERRKGSIRFDNAPGGGAVFSIDIPL